MRANGLRHEIPKLVGGETRFLRSGQGAVAIGPEIMDETRVSSDLEKRKRSMSKEKSSKARSVDVVLGDLTKELPKERSAHHPVTCQNIYCFPV